MGKETKIGLAVIFLLLIVFGVVLYQRLNQPAEDAAAAVTDPTDDGNAADAEPEASKSTSGPGEASTGNAASGQRRLHPKKRRGRHWCLDSNLCRLVRRRRRS